MMDRLRTGRHCVLEVGQADGRGVHDLAVVGDRDGKRREAMLVGNLPNRLVQLTGGIRNGKAAANGGGRQHDPGGKPRRGTGKNGPSTHDSPFLAAIGRDSLPVDRARFVRRPTDPSTDAAPWASARAPHRRASVPANKPDPAQALSPELRQLLVNEMQLIDDGMGELLSAISDGDRKTTEAIASKIRNRFTRQPESQIGYHVR